MCVKTERKLLGQLFFYLKQTVQIYIQICFRNYLQPCPFRPAVSVKSLISSLSEWKVHQK